MRKKKIEKVLREMYIELEGKITAASTGDEFEKISGKQILINEIADRLGVRHIWLGRFYGKG